MGARTRLRWHSNAPSNRQAPGPCEGKSSASATVFARAAGTVAARSRCAWHRPPVSSAFTRVPLQVPTDDVGAAGAVILLARCRGTSPRVIPLGAAGCRGRHVTRWSAQIRPRASEDQPLRGGLGQTALQRDRFARDALCSGASPDLSSLAGMGRIYFPMVGPVSEQLTLMQFEMFR